MKRNTIVTAIVIAALALTGCAQAKPDKYFAGYVVPLNKDLTTFHKQYEDTCSAMNVSYDDYVNCTDLSETTRITVSNAYKELSTLKTDQMSSDIKPLYKATMKKIAVARPLMKKAASDCGFHTYDGTTKIPTTEETQTTCWTAAYNEGAAFDSLYQTVQRWEPYL